MVFHRSASEVCFAAVLLAGLLASVCLSIKVLSAESRGVNAETSLMPEPASVNEGRVVAGIVREVTFHLRNCAQNAVGIAEVRTSCGCNGQTEFAKEPISPGASGDVKIKYQPRSGKYEAAFVVKGSDEREVSLTIRYEGYSDVQVDPSEIDFGNILPGQTVTREALVLADPTIIRDLSVKVGQSTAPWVSVEILPFPSGDGSVNAPSPDYPMERGKEAVKRTQRAKARTLRVVATAGAVGGPFSEIVSLEATDRNGSRTVPVKCLGKVVDPIRIVPARIVLRSGTSPAKIEVLVQSADDPVHIASVESDIVDCVSVIPSSSQRVTRLELTPKSGALRRSGNMHIRVDAPQSKDIVVPVVWDPPESAAP